MLVTQLGSNRRASRCGLANLGISGPRPSSSPPEPADSQSSGHGAGMMAQE